MEDFGGAQVAADVPLASLTTLRVGPVARRVITCVATEQIVTALRTLDSWACDREIFLSRGEQIRKEFDSYSKLDPSSG